MAAAWREGMPGGVRPSNQTQPQIEQSQEANGRSDRERGQRGTADMNDASRRSVLLETDIAFTTIAVALATVYAAFVTVRLYHVLHALVNASGSRSRSAGAGAEVGAD